MLILNSLIKKCSMHFTTFLNLPRTFLGKHEVSRSAWMFPSSCSVLFWVWCYRISCWFSAMFLASVKVQWIERIVPVSFGQGILISHRKIEDDQICTLMDARNIAAIQQEINSIKLITESREPWSWSTDFTFSKEGSREIKESCKWIEYFLIKLLRINMLNIWVLLRWTSF